MSFQSVLDKHREVSFSKRDTGGRFERLMQRFLQTYPVYTDSFEVVWLWDDFPYHGQFGGQDVGIDLVALTHEGEYWAVQCKCFAENTYMSKEDVDSFLATSSKQFTLDDGEVVGFSQRLWISTSDRWGKNAEESFHNQYPPVSRLNLSELESAPIDWDKLDDGLFGIEARAKKHTIRPHQQKALDAVHEAFKTEERGKLIMACGTGKTFTALKIAEKECAEEGSEGLVLVLVPSIALVGQTLREWTAYSERPIHPLCVCSDESVSKAKKSLDVKEESVVDLALPASTNVETIVRQIQRAMRKREEGELVVVFSTYQSIEVVSSAQRAFDWAFDLIICDEAHRTTGVTLSGEDESAFVRVHDGEFLKARHRLYMTATPRLFSESSKKKAEINDAVLCSMDDEGLYGREIHRLGFGQAVNEGLLSDYKVLVLTLSDKDITPSVQIMVSGSDRSINTDDACKLIGCINALSKQVVGEGGDVIRESDPLPMKRAVAFCSKIATSKEITKYFNEVSAGYSSDLSEERQKAVVSVESQHIDGSMNAANRDGLIRWLKEESDGCRVLTNVRCLSEGVDVPSLDAVMFLSARNSQIDVVQSVGRVMRKAPGKKFGYIIIPVVVPSNVEADKVLDDNERFKVVWTVLNALRAHDDRFNATINKLDLNKKRPENILIGGVVGSDTDDMDGVRSTIQSKLALSFDELQDAIYARMVLKVGERQYWEHWAKKVADIAQKQIGRMKNLVQNADVVEVFTEFVESLRSNINESIDDDQAIEMLSQHMITRPVFEALFENYSFAENNPVSKSMQKMIAILEENAFDKDTASLSQFYESVKDTARGIDNSAGRQAVVVKLYDNFFKMAFPRMVEQLGIVYTPVEVVDFIVRSVDDVLKAEFGRGLSDRDVNILDPFTGTGTFVTRLLESGLIDAKDLERKYSSEIFANEIVLLAYYIAAVNIENAFHSLMPVGTEYKVFEGICLTDTFAMYEYKEGEQIASEFFPKNNERVERQKSKPITVIMGNPPYSVGQKSANDNAQNLKYPKLDSRVANTYARDSNATNKNSLYDSYIKAFRWATDRIGEGDGVIGFVTNGSWLDGSATDGFRKHLEREFSKIYVFNLRGNQRTSGELSRKEGGKIFGSGSRTPVSITLLVKRVGDTSEKAEILYHDIGDYLSREEKLDIVRNFETVTNMDWTVLHPNAEGDWLNPRNPLFDTFIPIGDKNGDEAETSFFTPLYSMGLGTSRDAWCYNSSRNVLDRNMRNTIDTYNKQTVIIKKSLEKNKYLKISDIRDNNPTKISWSSSLEAYAKRGIKTEFNENKIVQSLYRPFFKQHVYFDGIFNHRVSKIPNIFPTPNTENLVICIDSMGGTKEVTQLISNVIPDLHFIGDSQCFPLYVYEETKPAASRTLASSQSSLFETVEQSEPYYKRKDGISDFIHEKAKKQYQDETITKEDIFYYVYGFLHSKTYKETFSNDLKKMLARLPLVESKEDFLAFSKAGRALAELHLHYETVEPYAGCEVSGTEFENYRVVQMKFAKGSDKKADKSRILYNDSIIVSGIPERAYEYIVNGKSAIEWIMERYAVTVNKDSGIKNDANDWADYVGDERYILDLLLRVITVSLKTMDIVDGLPRVEFNGGVHG